jgi:signal transduction histidine kinase
MERVGPRVAVAVRVLAAALIVAAAAGALAIARGPGRSVTYAGRSSTAAALLVLAGAGLGLAGLITSAVGRVRRIAVLAVLAGFTWFAPVFVAWQDGPAAVRSVAMVLTGFTFAFLAHLALAYPDGRIGARPVRVLVVAVYLEALVVAVALALFRDPYFDPSCWANCTVNSFLAHSFPSFVHGVEVADRWFVAVAAVALIAVCVVRLFRASPPARARLAPVWLPATMFAAAVAARALALQRISTEDPFNDTLFAIFVASSAGLILLAAGVLWSVVRVRAQRRAVAQIAADLDEAPAPGSMQAALARALRDPDLRIAYWLPGGETFVDAGGNPVPDPTALPGRVATRLVRSGRMIAVISHSGAAGEVEAQIGPAVLLGLENERLQAEVLAQLSELRASRARVVETADSERRRLERDLHDGAQQKLLALSYDIRLARATADTHQDSATATTLTRAVEEANDAITDLRELAHGIYPAVLTEAGLGPALETIADTAPLPIEILPSEDRRYPAAVEAAAYFAVTHAIEDAARRGADHATVTFSRRDGKLVVTIDGNGRGHPSPTPAVADRVGAIAGEITTTDTAWQVEIPCE